MFLVGQPELEARLARPELRQLRQRISVHYRLKPLSAADSERYIHHRITVAGGYAPDVSPADACAEVYRLSNGVPREINQICAQAMHGAFVEDARPVAPEHVRAAAARIEFESVMSEGRAAEVRTPPALAAAAIPAAPAAVAPPRAAPPPPPPAAAPPPPIAEASAPPPIVCAAPATPPPPPMPAPRRVPTTLAAVDDELLGALRDLAVEIVEQHPQWRLGRPRAGVELRAARGAGNDIAAASGILARVKSNESAPETPRRTKPWRGGEDDFDPSAIALKWLLAVAAVAAIATSVVLYERFAPEAKLKPSGAATESPRPPESSSSSRVGTVPGPAVHAPARHAPPAAAAPALPHAPKASASNRVAKPAAASPHRVSTLPAAAQRSSAPKTAVAAPVAGASSGAGAPVAPAAPQRTETATPTRSFAVAVGTFLDDGICGPALPRLVRTVTADSVSRFELVLGLFRSHDAAERAASDLISRGLVDEARVVAQVQSPAQR